MDTREVIPFPQKLELTLTLPGSKSITNRAILCAALAKGKSRIEGALKSEDTDFMIAALKHLGIWIRERKKGIEIEGRGGCFKKGKIMLSCGNAGTTTRFLAAISMLRSDPTIITGNVRMQKRPIQDLMEGLKQLGATIHYLGKKGCPPVEIRKQSAAAEENRKQKKNHSIKIKGNQSSQYLSALLILAPLLSKPLTIRVIGKLTSQPYVDMTLAVMKRFGIQVRRKGYQLFSIKPQSYRPCRYQVEGDSTAATYFSSLNFLHGGTLRFTNLNYNHSIQGDVDYPACLEQVGRRTLDMASMPDAAMTLAVTAAFQKKPTVIQGLHTLKIKETDRLKALKNELEKIGLFVKTTKNSLAIHPGNRKRETGNRNILIHTYEDHRMAMCFAVAGTLIPGLLIRDPDCVTKTYPNFWKDLELAYLTKLPLKHKHLVLIGMRGAGKTYLGKKLAKFLGRPFIDIDHEIERDQGMTIGEMVRRHGWDYFRRIEQKICSSIIAKEQRATRPMVISTGGGVVLNPLNMKHLKANALTVFIFADPPVLAERVMQGSNRPPLKKGQDPATEIEKLWQKRRPLYLQYADYVWDNTSGEVIQNNFGLLLRK